MNVSHAKLVMLDDDDEREIVMNVLWEENKI